MTAVRFAIALLVVRASAPLSVAGAESAIPGSWPAPILEVLEQAGTNRTELLTALTRVPEDQRPGMRFLIEHLPPPDRTGLDAGFLLENVALAYEARRRFPWAAAVPEALFLNDVLPHACVNETRDRWRPRLLELCAPLVQDCTTAAEAAHRLNQKLFGLVNVRYSTQRRRADQSALETIASGMATCTGLSILLVDACRAVGVPARVVGTPSWTTKRGNHTWVEIWDDDWHFLGAAEPDPQGLNRGWFVHDAAQARRDDPRHAIYASSYRATGLVFPLVWARRIDWVNAVNVTDRYAASTPAPDAERCRLLVQILDRPNGSRVTARVTVMDSGTSEVIAEGMSRGESADLNDILPFELPVGKAWRIRVNHAGGTLERPFTTPATAQTTLIIPLGE